MSKPMVAAQYPLRRAERLILDALELASLQAGRLAEDFEGNDGTLFLEDVRKAIVDFQFNHPAMKALSSASLRHRA